MGIGAALLQHIHAGDHIHVVAALNMDHLVIVTTF
jgi:hypothetical protein